MKTILGRLRKKEDGQALILVILLLAMGSLMTIPLVKYMNSSLEVNKTHDQLMDELYAAEAGIKTAIWHIRIGTDEIPMPGESAWSYSIADMNDKVVNPAIEQIEDLVFKINSVATSDDGHTTTVESYVITSASFTFILDNAITSPNDVAIAPGTQVYGNVQYNGELDNKGDIYGDIITDEINWPSGDVIDRYYLDEVDHLTPLPTGYNIDISSGTLENPYSIGPLYAGGNLTISGGGVAIVDGTVYVAGNFVIMPGCTLYLNENAIFACGTISVQPGCSIYGPGCLISIGDLDYQPSVCGEEFVLLMSVEGDVKLHPADTFYGCIAGDMFVDAQPSGSINWVAPSEGTNFLGWNDDDGSGYGYGVQIYSWEVK